MSEAPDFDENPKINIFDMQIEDRRTLYCDRVSVRLILGSRVTFVTLRKAI